jgi:serine phosphatase RsbU (regulator of sigma subunit)
MEAKIIMTAPPTAPRKSPSLRIGPEQLLKMTRSRLSRRIAFYVFVSVVLIETIILIPSYAKREKDLLQQLRILATAQIDVLMDMLPTTANADDIFKQVKYLLMGPHILGGALYDVNGSIIGTFGEPPALSFANVVSTGMLSKSSADNLRIDDAWTATQLRRANVLILRQDASPVKRELWAYILRIAGLVVIISLFVTTGAWIALNPIVVIPILRLRKDLVSAGEALSNDSETPAFYAESVYRRDELGDVITAFKQMYHRISEAISERKKAETALKKSLEQVEAYSLALNTEMVRGREMQKNFLPDVLPQPDGWKFAAFFRPARQVSGDFYDVFELPDGSVGLVIADVCDKGVGAALFMALIRSLIRIFSGQTALQGLDCRIVETLIRPEATQDEADIGGRARQDALKAVRLTNDYIAKNHEDLAMFATIFFGVLDPATGELTYINGGHDPLYILDRSGRVKDHLGPTGPAVGVRADVDLEERRAQIEPGDILYGYTDGVTEARNPDGEFFTEKKLLALLKKGAGSASELLENISNALEAYTGEAEQFDDITMLAVRRIP